MGEVQIIGPQVSMRQWQHEDDEEIIGRATEVSAGISLEEAASALNEGRVAVVMPDGKITFRRGIESAISIFDGVVHSNELNLIDVNSVNFNLSYTISNEPPPAYVSRAKGTLPSHWSVKATKGAFVGLHYAAAPFRWAEKQVVDGASWGVKKVCEHNPKFCAVPKTAVFVIGNAIDGISQTESAQTISKVAQAFENAKDALGQAACDQFPTQCLVYSTIPEVASRIFPSTLDQLEAAGLSKQELAGAGHDALSLAMWAHPAVMRARALGSNVISKAGPFLMGTEEAVAVTTEGVMMPVAAETENISMSIIDKFKGWFGKKTPAETPATSAKAPYRTQNLYNPQKHQESMGKYYDALAQERRIIEARNTPKLEFLPDHYPHHVGNLVSEGSFYEFGTIRAGNGGHMMRGNLVFKRVGPDRAVVYVGQKLNHPTVRSKMGSNELVNVTPGMNVEARTEGYIEALDRFTREHNVKQLEVVYDPKCTQLATALHNQERQLEISRITSYKSAKPGQELVRMEMEVGGKVQPKLERPSPIIPKAAQPNASAAAEVKQLGAIENDNLLRRQIAGKKEPTPLPKGFPTSVHNIEAELGLQLPKLPSKQQPIDALPFQKFEDKSAVAHFNPSTVKEAPGTKMHERVAETLAQYEQVAASEGIKRFYFAYDPSKVPLLDQLSKLGRLTDVKSVRSFSAGKRSDKLNLLEVLVPAKTK